MSSRRLAVRVIGVLLVPLLVCWYVVSQFFLLTDGQRARLGAAMPLVVLVIAGLAAAAVAALTSPVRRALTAPPADRPAREGGALAALRMPGRLSTTLLAGAAVLVAAVTMLELRAGLPGDLALAGGCAGLAFAVMGSMLAHSVAVGELAPVLAQLGSVDLRERETVRGKIMAVGYGVLAIAALLLVPAAYVRYRLDTDRMYLDGAAAAQERGARLLATSGQPADVAELVYLGSGAPTAVVDAAGRVLARAPEAGPSLELGRLEPGSGVEPLAGAWRLRRVAGPVTLVSLLPEEPLMRQRQAFWEQAATLSVAIFAACALLVWLSARSLTLPLRYLRPAADRIAAGDLTATPPSVSRDELGQLAADFRKMAHGLAALVTDVDAATRGVQGGAREVGEIGGRVRGGVREEHDRIVAVQAAVEAMQGSVRLVGHGVEELGEYVHGTSAAVGEMAAALEEVRRQAAELERRVEATGGDVQHLSEAGGRAETQLGALGTLAANAQGSLAAVSASLSGLESSAVASQLAAAQAAELADHAGGVVQVTVDGIESVRAAVADAKGRVTALGRRSDDIDTILDFIGEVAGRTNLLSLNASIIATQAGEHGKAFAVVADQIRELAAQISTSSNSIGQIIRSVRDDVSGSARLIDRGDELAAEGVAHARKSLLALHEIRSATAKGHETAAAIREAVQAHAASMRDVSTLVGSVAGHSAGVSDALRMVRTSVDAVGSMAQAVGALADGVSRALEEQTGLGRRQLEGLEHIDGMLGDIKRAAENHDAATRRVREALEYLSGTAERHEGAVVELSGVAERLEARSRALADRVGRFKIQ